MGVTLSRCATPIVATGYLGSGLEQFRRAENHVQLHSAHQRNLPGSIRLLWPDLKVVNRGG